MKLRVWLAAMSLTVAGASAQNSGVSFTITAPKTEFYFGEIIPLTLSFSATVPRTFLADGALYDRVGRMNFHEVFVVEPASLAEDPLQGQFASQGGMGGLYGGPVILSEKPYTFERRLNEWVRFRRPGEYQVHVVSRRASQVEDPTQSDEQLRMKARSKPVELVSNTLTLTIRPAPAAWVAEQISAAKATLDAPEATDEESVHERLRAMRTLRFLESPEAAEALAMRLPEGSDVDSFGAYLGVLGSPYRKQVLAVMERRLVSVEQPVWSRYLDSLAELAEWVAEGGPMPPYPKNAAEQKAWQAESQRRLAVRNQKRDEYVARLLAVLPSKQPRARAVSMETVLNLSTRIGAEPPWLRDVAASLVADFQSLPTQTRSMLLESRWDLLKKSPAMLPALREMLSDRQLQSVALRRLYELAPEEGRAVVVEEIRDGKKGIPHAALVILNDDSLPELNEVLAERGDAVLIVRYATGDVVTRVESGYLAHAAELAKQDLPACAGPLVFYFLKYDPPFGERVLRAEFAKPGAPPACYDLGSQMSMLGRWAYSPALEKLAIESLNSGKVPIKRGAAQVLGKYGTAAARKPLWEAMEYFRSWWKGREEELKGRTGEESVQLELALRTALARAGGWKLDEADLRRLLELCSSEWCRNDVNGWLSEAKAAVK